MGIMRECGEALRAKYGSYRLEAAVFWATARERDRRLGNAKGMQELDASLLPFARGETPASPKEEDIVRNRTQQDAIDLEEYETAIEASLMNYVPGFDAATCTLDWPTLACYAYTFAGLSASDRAEVIKAHDAYTSGPAPSSWSCPSSVAQDAAYKDARLPAAPAPVDLGGAKPPNYLLWGGLGVAALAVVGVAIAASGSSERAENPTDRRIHFKQGDLLLVAPIGKGLQKSLPASKWLTKETVVEALEEGASGGLDVYDVATPDGRVESVYGVQVVKKLKANPTRKKVSRSGSSVIDEATGFLAVKNVRRDMNEFLKDITAKALKEITVAQHKTIDGLAVKLIKAGYDMYTFEIPSELIILARTPTGLRELDHDGWGIFYMEFGVDMSGPSVWLEMGL